MSVVDRLADELRQPEYTGENRCTPCTVTNLLITAVVAAGLAVVNPLVAVAFAVLGVGAIAFRGYLVPGTPTLTKRYFPPWLLELFGKEPAGTADAPAYEGDVDPESYLLDHGVITETPDGEDLELVDGFWPTWRDAIERADEDLAAEVGDLLELEEPQVNPGGTITPAEEASGCTVYDGDVRVAQWPSEAALAADLGAIDALADHGIDVAAMDRGDAGQLLAGLRVFAEACPDCGGEMALGEDTVESCCSVADVFTYDCRDCGTRVMEIQAA
ncbi:hypothetical protein RYH80_13685 [Halobaculum sp. MBLA0147]|uniref:hypothetical protein n=1 Tax=Halobaculum sp. MBLA0147 TaxID=3079934 RepID=UPI00352432B2